MTKSCISFLTMPRPHKMSDSDINSGTQGRKACLGFCKKVSVCKIHRGEYLMRRHDIGKNSLPARAMEEDTSPFARAPKNAISAQSRAPRNPPTTQLTNPYGALCSSRTRVRNNFVPNSASATGVWLHQFSM